MSTDSLLGLTYWGGWLSAAVALVYKLLLTVNVIPVTTVWELNILPRHFWQLSFLLFVICIATDALARRKSA